MGVEEEKRKMAMNGKAKSINPLANRGEEMKNKET